jgi:sulfite reductase (ferredoxin)
MYKYSSMSDTITPAPATPRSSWKQVLADRIPEAVGREIDAFELEMTLRKQGKIEDKVFAEARLRRGAYGQRYDNGHRHDGEQTRDLNFPAGALTKGPDTMWDAPGMQRIKLPYGAVSAEQLDVLADIAEEYSDAILHVTTRQDIQLHFVHIDDTPDMMRRLAAVGITTKEACGNSVRNVTACPYAGVCHDEAFDVSPYAHAVTYFLLGHPDTQDFGRKFKIAFSGCEQHACALVAMHDLGGIAKTKVIDGTTVRGFDLYVGGGLGSVPQQAKLLAEFLPESELLPMAQAVSRVFARWGEKKNRARARVKFVVSKLGIDEFRRLVLEERAQLVEDPRWTAFLANLHVTDEHPLRPGAEPDDQYVLPDLEKWYLTNIRPQRQPGYVTATVTLPLGDLTSFQARALADLARKYTGDTMRTTVEQNLVFRWLPKADVAAFHQELKAIGLAEAGAGTITDITSCPGTDTCKLGISSSRGLTHELRQRLTLQTLPSSTENLRVKCSGCFNACGQHHVADIGFLGVSRNVNGRRVPHFQLVVGGKWSENAGAFGLAIGAVPSKRVPEVLERITQAFERDKHPHESFQAFIQRTGKAKIKELIQDLTEVPSYEADPSFYSDWGDPREYTIGDMGVGECAGEVIPFVQFGLVASEREAFEAQLLLDQGKARQAAEKAFSAMLQAAKALTRLLHQNLTDNTDEIVAEFRTRLCEPKLFHDPFAGDKFAHYLFKAHRSEGSDDSAVTLEQAHQRVEEAQLFIEASHACYSKLLESKLV